MAMLFHSDSENPLKESVDCQIFSNLSYLLIDKVVRLEPGDNPTIGFNAERIPSIFNVTSSLSYKQC